MIDKYMFSYIKQNFYNIVICLPDDAGLRYEAASKVPNKESAASGILLQSFMLLIILLKHPSSAESPPRSLRTHAHKEWAWLESCWPYGPTLMWYFLRYNVACKKRVTCNLQGSIKWKALEISAVNLIEMQYCLAKRTDLEQGSLRFLLVELMEISKERSPSEVPYLWTSPWTTVRSDVVVQTECMLWFVLIYDSFA